MSLPSLLRDLPPALTSALAVAAPPAALATALAVTVALAPALSTPPPALAPALAATVSLSLAPALIPPLAPEPPLIQTNRSCSKSPGMIFRVVSRKAFFLHKS